jgi:hypothetical protein
MAVMVALFMCHLAEAETMAMKADQVLTMIGLLEAMMVVALIQVGILEIAHQAQIAQLLIAQETEEIVGHTRHHLNNLHQAVLVIRRLVGPLQVRLADQANLRLAGLLVAEGCDQGNFLKP